MKVKIIHLPPLLSDDETKSLAATFLKDSDCKTLINYDADVYCQDSGICLAKFRKGVIPQDVQRRAFTACKDHPAFEFKLGMRGVAGGFSHEKALQTALDIGAKGYQRQSEDSVRFHAIWKDGKRSNTTICVPVASGVMGYSDRTGMRPYCRETAFNSEQFDKFKEAYPLIRCVDETYSKLMPDEYKFQRDLADRTSQDFVIKNTAFTTITVNKNWQTAVHTDKGDLEEGFGNLVALRAGRFTGGYLTLPKWGVGFDLENSDILLVDVHQWHGNTPIKKIDGNAVRLSFVMYYRKKMIDCGTIQEEQNRIKHKERVYTEYNEDGSRK